MPTLEFPPTIRSRHFIKFILKHYKANKVEQICLSFWKFLNGSPTSDEIDSWMQLACCRGEVKKLFVDLQFLEPFYSRGTRISHWFTHACPSFSTLKVLNLASCLFAPPASKCLTSLETLILQGVLLDDNVIEEFTSSCPMLQELFLVNCNLYAPLHVSITNPKMSKLSIHDDTRSTSVLELYAPHLSTLIIGCYFRGHYNFKAVSSLATVRITFDSLFVSRHEKIALMEILNGTRHARELYLSANCIKSVLRKKEEMGLLAPCMNVKCLHLQSQEFPHDFPGMVQFLGCYGGVETLVLNLEMYFDKISIARHLSYLNSAVRLEDRDFDNKDKEKLVCLDEQNSWSSLRFLLSHQMPDLKNIVINGFKRMYKIGDVYNPNDSDHTHGCHAVDKFEFKLLRLLLKYSFGLETMTVRTKDIYLIQVDEKGMETLTMKCKNVCLDPEVDKMEVPQWDKMMLSLPRASPRAEINITC